MKKKFLINLLILLALSLCGLCAYQWLRETRLRQQVQALSQESSQKTAQIQGLEISLRNSEDHVRRLDERNAELKAIIKTNQAEILTLTRDLRAAEAEQKRTAEQLEVYKQAFEVQKATTLKQNEDIKELNALIKKVAAERDDFVAKFNETMKERNDIVQKYNDFVEQVQKFQQQQAGQDKPK